jgi:phosphatidylglycerol phospholipase C
MDEIIRAQPDWQTVLAPRILLGMWHPAFIPHAKSRLPYCRTAFIGRNLYTARTYFFKEVDGFSINFFSLTTPDGKK